MKYNDIRRNSKSVRIKDKYIGGGNDVLIQSMTNTDTLNFEETLAQVIELEKAGCDIVRITVPTVESAKAISYIKNSGVEIPLVADIHFDYRIALECVKNGVDKIRINPGNIGAEWKIKEVTDACNSEGVPIRIGVNGGSLEKHILEKYGTPTDKALTESAFYHMELLSKFGFFNTVVSVKSSDVRAMISANRMIAEQSDCPIHLGVTEAGDSYSGLIKSSVGIGGLLCDGIGDTIRVSLTANPVEEVRAGKELLSTLGFYNKGSIQIVSCPTCGRTKINLIELSSEFKKAINDIDTKGKCIKVALMGCVVNGPGEARDCDVGIAGGKGEAVLFRHGEIIGKIAEKDVISKLKEEIVKIITEK